MPHPTPSAQRISGGLFVTGTDTGVGKTMVTAALGMALQRLGLNTGVMKPIETGIASRVDGPPNDGALLHSLLAPEELKELIMPYQFEKPLAPLEAARQANSTVRFEVISDAYRTLAARHEYMLVEGVGGVMVPLSQQFDVRDLIKLLELPCLLVCGISLGSVNHTRLTLKALRDYGIPILAIVMNETGLPPASPDHMVQQESTVNLIRQFCPAPVFGPMPYQKNMGKDWVEGVTFLSRTTAMCELATMIWPGA